MKKYLVLLFLAVSSNSMAIETPAPFKIDKIYLANAENFHFRVLRNTTDGTWLCNNGPKNPAWAYINESDSGSKGKMSALLAAYAAKKTVQLYTEGVDTSAGRMCKIVEFIISD